MALMKLGFISQLHLEFVLDRRRKKISFDSSPLSTPLKKYENGEEPITHLGGVGESSKALE